MGEHQDFEDTILNSATLQDVRSAPAAKQHSTLRQHQQSNLIESYTQEVIRQRNEIKELKERLLKYIDSPEGKNYCASQQRDTANRTCDELEKELEKSNLIVDKMRHALEYVQEILAVIGKLGHCPQGGEQTGNQMHVWEAEKIVKAALKDVSWPTGKEAMQTSKCSFPQNIKSTRICTECKAEFSEDDVPKDSEYCLVCFNDLCGTYFYS